MTARYPATFDIVLRTSSAWAREIRGTASRARALTPWCQKAWTRSGRAAGAIIETIVAPERSRAMSSSAGGLTQVTMSLAHTSSWPTTDAPAAT